MARPQPSNKQSFVLIALWALTFVLLMQMLNGSKNNSAKPSADLFKTLQLQNTEMMDVSINSTFHQYTGKVDEDVKAKKLTEAQGEAKKIEAGILTAETQLRAGLVRNETARVRLAYQTLWSFQKRLLDKPEWRDTKVTTFDSSKLELTKEMGQSQWTGQELFERTSKILSERNQKELIWGFIPGGYHFIDMLVKATGANPHFSYAFAAFLLALIVRAAVFPLSQKQLMFSRQMGQLTPLTTEIKEKYKDDPAQMQQKTMALYQEYGINPMAGCAPALVQMPLFLTVYQCMLLYQFTFQNGYFAWINPSLSKATHGFIAPNLGQQDTILIIIYGISMVITTLLAPVSDPAQKKQQRMLGVGISVVFTFFMFTGAFPVVAGFVLYWTFTNILATLQSLRAYNLPLPPLVKVNAKGGGVFPIDLPSAPNPAEGPQFPWSKGGKKKDDSSKNGSGPKKSPGTGKPKQHKPKN